MTYIELYICGLLNIETVTKKVKNRDFPKDLTDNVIAYRFFDRSEVMINGYQVMDEKKNYSQMTYVGQTYSVEDLKNCPNTLALQEKMKVNNWKKVVCTKSGSLQPIDNEGMLVNC